MARPAASNPFFRTWSPTMAYILGYWWADGYMRIHSNTGGHFVQIASIDIEHLQAIADAIGATTALRQVRKESTCHEMVICNQGLYHDLLNLGGIPNKSHVIGFPNVPTEYLVDFIRGFIDGDGTLAWNGDRPVIQIYSGSQQLLLETGRYIELMTGIPAPNISHNRNNYYIKWSTIRAKCLAIWLYRNNNGLMLARKAAIAQQFEQWQPKKSPERGTITEKMRLHFANYLP